MNSETTNSFQSLFTQGKEYLELKCQYAKLTLAERLTIILSALVVGAIVLFISVIALFFLSVAVVNWLSAYMSLGWACTVVGLFYVIVGCLIVVFRKPLIENPIARLVSRSIL